MLSYDDDFFIIVEYICTLGSNVLVCMYKIEFAVNPSTFRKKQDPNCLSSDKQVFDQNLIIMKLTDVEICI